MKKFLLLSTTLLFAFADTDAQVQRKCVMEDFGSITCPPCYSFAQWFDPWEASKKANDATSNLVVVKYQMDWPGIGDSSFNNDGYNRRIYYNVTGIPTFNVNGTKTTAGASSIDGIYTTCSSGMSDLKIEGTYLVKGDSLLYDITITPSANIAGAHTVQIAATQKHYYHPGGTNQNDYTHIMRKMLPNGNGNAVAGGFTSGTPVKFKGGYKFKVSAVPKQGSFDFWSSPFEGHLVVFVQNNTTKAIVQGESFAAKWPSSITEASNFHHTVVYPNPAGTQAAVLFSLNNTADVTVNITDVVGRVVYTRNAETFNMGKNRINLSTENLANGTYSITLLSSDGSRYTTPLSVLK